MEVIAGAASRLFCDGGCERVRLGSPHFDHCGELFTSFLWPPRSPSGVAGRHLAGPVLGQRQGRA